jgi:hypothetical protein
MGVCERQGAFPRDDGVAAALFIMAAEQGHEHAAKLLPYVRQQPNTQLPACLLPDPLMPVRTAVEEAAVSARDRSEIEQLVHRLAPQYAIDSQLALAVISAEVVVQSRSGFAEECPGVDAADTRDCGAFRRQENTQSCRKHQRRTCVPALAAGIFRR